MKICKVLSQIVLMMILLSGVCAVRTPKSVRLRLSDNQIGPDEKLIVNPLP